MTWTTANGPRSSAGRLLSVPLKVVEWELHVLCVEWPKDPSAVAGISGRFLDSLGSWFGELGAQSEELRVQQQIADEDWARCPSLPSQEDFTTLRDCRVYEDAVDLLARMQRQMRERAAWIAMIRAMGYPTADERYVGVFVNDAMKNKVAWLLSVRVPVFIAHRYASHEQPRSVANGTPRLTSFTEGTEVGLRKSRQANSYAFIAAREGFAVTGYEEDQGRAPDSSAAHRDPHFSSSLYLEARAKARAGQAELPREPPRRPLTGDDLRFEAPPPSSLLVHPHRVEWILPPPVPPNPVGKRWEKWEMTQDEKTSDYVFLKHGHKWRAEGEVEIWYDRHLVRELYLDDSWEMDVGVVGSAVFGAPAPRIRYYDASDQDRPRRTKPSLWMYRSRTGDPTHVGTLPQQPSAEQLPRRIGASPSPITSASPQLEERWNAAVSASPLLEERRDEESRPPAPITSETRMDSPSPLPRPHDESITIEEPVTEVPAVTNRLSKGKAKEIPAAKYERDSVSLGPESDVEMLVDEGTAPTRFVQIRHLTGNPTVFQFMEELGPVIRENTGVTIVSALGAQHAIWVCMESVREAEDLVSFLQVLGRVGPDPDITFEPEDSYAEAQLYCFDIWRPDLATDAEAVTEVPPSPPKRSYEHWTPYEPVAPLLEAPTRNGRRDGSDPGRDRAPIPGSGIAPLVILDGLVDHGRVRSDPAPLAGDEIVGLRQTNTGGRAEDERGPLVEEIVAGGVPDRIHDHDREGVSVVGRFCADVPHWTTSEGVAPSFRQGAHLGQHHVVAPLRRQDNSAPESDESVRSARGRPVTRERSPPRRRHNQPVTRSPAARSTSPSLERSQKELRTQSPALSGRSSYPRSEGVPRSSSTSESSAPVPALYGRLYHPPRPLTPLPEAHAQPTLSLGQRLSIPGPSSGARMTYPSRETGDLMRRIGVPLQERLREAGDESEFAPERPKRGRRAGKKNIHPDKKRQRRNPPEQAYNCLSALPSWVPKSYNGSRSAVVQQRRALLTPEERGRPTSTGAPQPGGARSHNTDVRPSPAEARSYAYDERLTLSRPALP
ncbi:hypothetical protein B0H15DRAFT_981029 [Mycena belliarum]|uniref:Uncharacterized protein n=1 Tax=Mycena belliarum TaxID=1033014 RepID=A0AAD6TMG6_9AGAR|nr:hypothetical protein B0H15DRAFT_981029 [Mycena belliae]